MRAMVVGALLILAAGSAQARITRIEIQSVEPFADGASFGAAGPYERVIGKAYGELDPQAQANAPIVNLDKAPVNARGMVEYDTDIFMLRPVDPAKGNRKILYEVTNRGRKLLAPYLHDAVETGPTGFNDPRSAADAGNALFFRLGFTMVWSGWDPDAPRANGGMTIRLPVARGATGPIVQVIRDEMMVGVRIPPADRLSVPLSYASADLDQAKVKLTVRRRAGDAPRLIPATGWAYVDDRTIKLLPDGTRFETGSLYDVWYPARDPWVSGIGYAATRDLIARLRTDLTARAALGFGISQSGRYLRHFIELGMNRDEAGAKVFDGVLTHISGIGKVFANHQFAQPNRTATQHEDHDFPENWFPFSSASVSDPITGATGSLPRGDGSDPLLIEVNTSTEYRQKGASLLHTDPLGTRDLALPPTTRVFMIAGTQHGGRANLTSAQGPCANPRNPHSAGPLLRALLVALDQWVEGVAPPPSRVPTLGDHNLVPADALELPRIPGLVTTALANRVTPLEDWIAPTEGARAYRTLVSQVDADGNELAGVRLPDIAVPRATYTGWNLYKAPYPEGELCDRDGSYAAFARSAAERAGTGDPRPSLAERYGDPATYVRRVDAAAAALVADRLLLAEDAARLVARAQQAEKF
jgi:Alpha/beta hydrolase domain